MTLEDLKTAIKASPYLFQTEINILTDIVPDPDATDISKSLRAKANKLIGKKEAYEEIGAKFDSLEKLYSREEVANFYARYHGMTEAKAKDLFNKRFDNWIDEKEAQNG